jgi:hypothetical protein
MSAKELAQEAMALPLAERVALAQTLWQSIGGQSADSVNTDVQWAVEEAAKRDAELSSGAVSGRTHGQVMRAARKAIE